MFRGFEEITSIPKGTRYTISEIGYYNYWYPSEEIRGVLSEAVSGIDIQWLGGGQKWNAYRVTSEVAVKYGSPIRVLWFAKEDLENG